MMYVAIRPPARITYEQIHNSIVEAMNVMGIHLPPFRYTMKFGIPSLDISDTPTRQVIGGVPPNAEERLL